MTETRTRCLTAVAVTFSLVLSCNSYDKDDFKTPTAPEDQFLQLTTEGNITEIPADGFSSVKIIATITGDAASDNRKIKFKTTAGRFTDSTATNGKEVERTVDASGRAVVELVSEPRNATAIVTAEVTMEARASNSIEVRFRSVDDPDTILKLESESGESTLPADGTSQLELVATIAQDLPNRTVTFNASHGTLKGGTMTSAGHEVTADGAGQARIRLQSETELVTSLVTADVTLPTETPFSRSLNIRFVEVDVEEVLRFVAAPSSAPADEETASFFTVKVGQQLLTGPKEVVFAIDGVGTFTPGMDDRLASVDVGPGRSEATAIVYSQRDTGHSRITAQIAGFTQEASIEFQRAFPNQILVSLTKFSVTTTETVKITGTLLRSVGKVTPDTVATFEARDKDGKVFGSFSDTDNTSNDSGEVLTDFTPGEGATEGTATMFVRVLRDQGTSVEGSAEFEVVAPSDDT